MTHPKTGKDWNPALYGQFGGLRLRPAMDLLAQVHDLPDGPIVDLGCGSGAAGPALRMRFPDRDLMGVDQSPAMLEEAEATGAYTQLVQGDVTDWVPDAAPALIFANAVLNWVPHHARVLPHLAGFLAPGGILAVQSPKQQNAPSHALLRSVSAEMFPDLFDWSGWSDHVQDLAGYMDILSALGDATLWETTYAQVLAADDQAHPVRKLTQSTAARRVLDKLTESEADSFLDAYDAALEDIYKRRPDGSVLFPFRRIFFTLRRPSA